MYSGPTRLHSIDVEVDPPPDGFEQIENEDRPHVMQIMVAAWRAREEASLGWSITPRISDAGRGGLFKTGYDRRLWGWQNISLAEILRIRDTSNGIYLKDIFIDFGFCPDGETHGCLRMVISSQRAENARLRSQAITANTIEDGIPGEHPSTARTICPRRCSTSPTHGDSSAPCPRLHLRLHLNHCFQTRSTQ